MSRLNMNLFFIFEEIFIINTGQSTLINPKNQEFVRAALIAFVSNNLFIVLPK
jgi:hypothetical protein